MKEIDELNLPGDIYYSKEHEWAAKDGEVIRISISDYAQDQLSDVVYVEAVAEVDQELAKGDPHSTVESVKAAADVYMPIGGKITEVNEELIVHIAEATVIDVLTIQ